MYIIQTITEIINCYQLIPTCLSIDRITLRAEYVCAVLIHQNILRVCAVSGQESLELTFSGNQISFEKETDLGTISFPPLATTGWVALQNRQRTERSTDLT